MTCLKLPFCFKIINLFLVDIYHNKCFLYRNLGQVWKKKNDIGFPTFKLPASTKIFSDWPVKYICIIFEDFGIWLLGYRIKFSCLYIPQGHYFIITLIKGCEVQMHMLLLFFSESPPITTSVLLNVQNLPMYLWLVNIYS